MTVQTAYGFIAPAVAGQIVDMYFNEIVSKLVETAAGLEFGVAVGRGTGDNQVVLAGTYGISVRELTREMDKRGAGAVTKYVLGNAAAIMRKGHVWVKLDAGSTLGVSPGDAVHYMPVTGVLVDSTTATSVAIPGATFEGTAAAGELVEVRLA